MGSVVAGIGTLLKRWNGSEYVDMAEISSIDNEKTRATADCTSLSSSMGYKEYIAVNRDAGTIQAPMNFTRDTYDLMQIDYENQEINNYKIVLPDDSQTSFLFSGYVSSLGLAVPADDKITANVVISVSGRITLSSEIFSYVFDETFDETFA